MIKKFLQEYQQRLTTNKIEIEEELDLVRTKIKENEKFIAMLHSEQDSFFTDFSPREVEEKHSDQIKELTQTLQGFYEERGRLNTRLSDVLSQLEEVEKVISEAERLEKPQIIEENVPSNNLTKPVTYHVIARKLKTVSDFLPADPIRAKIEVQEILKML